MVREPHSSEPGADPLLEDGWAKLAGIVGSLLACFFAIAIMSRIGVPRPLLSGVLAAIPMTIVIYAAIRAISMNTDSYITAGRAVPPALNAMAGAAEWISVGLFVALAALFHADGGDGPALAIGMAGGFALAAVLIAPPLRQARAGSMAGFIGERFASAPFRLCVVVAVVVCSFALLVTQLAIIGEVGSWFFPVGRVNAISVTIIVMLFVTLAGGMRAITLANALLFILLAGAYLIPATWLSTTIAGIPLPQLAYGTGALQPILALERELADSGFIGSMQIAQPGFAAAATDGFNTIALALSVAAGTAVAPFMVARFICTGTAADSRRSLALAPILIAVVVSSAPAMAAFVKFEVYRDVVGLPVGELAPSAPWLFKWAAFGDGAHATICGASAFDLETLITACGGADHVVIPSDVSLSPLLMTLGAADIADLPFAVGGFVTIGAIAAAAATGCVVLLVIANTLALDGWVATSGRSATVVGRMFVARLLAVALAIAAGWIAIARPADLPEMAVTTFALAAAGLFPAMVAGIWWRGLTAAGGSIGILVGLGLGVYYVIGANLGLDLMANSGDEIGWAIPGLTDRLAPQSIAIVAAPAGAVAMIAISLAQRAFTGRVAQDETKAD